MAAKQIDRFEFERVLWRQNVTRVAGVDEAGRGPLAGPVVAAAAILPPRWAETGLPAGLAGLNDSKQLTEAQRKKFFEFLTTCAEIEFAIAAVDAGVIDVINILQATHRAMNDALAQLSPLPPHALVDGRPVKTLSVPQTAIVKGDTRSYSIAAASVLAKVTRDRLMLEYAAQFPEYGFAEHKGYGTAKHLAAIAAHGACPIHRKTFAPLKPAAPKLFLHGLDGFAQIIICKSNRDNPCLNSDLE
jgi:ribonuclease HII